MPTFAYEAVDAKGQRIEGSEEAASPEALASQLVLRGLQPIRIKRAQRLQTLLTRTGPRISHDDLLYFTKELGELLEAGVSLERALAIVADAADKAPVRELLSAIREDIQGGRNLSDALSAFPEVFNRLYVNMVRVGELGGVLPAVLKRLEDFLQRSREIRKFIITSSIYPSILILVGLVSIFILVTFVVPKFGQIFQDLHQQMPFMTRMIVGTSQFLQSWWWLIVLLVGVLGGGFYAYVRSEEGRAWWDRMLLRLPMVRPMLLRLELSRLARTLGTLIESGVPILKGIALSGEVLDNSVLRAAVDSLYKGVRQGQSLSLLMRRSDLFPSLMIHMVAIGEETGQMGTMLLKIADDFDEKIRHDTRIYLSLIEPVTIVVMGVIMGAIIMSMLLAIFGINDVAL